MVAQNNADPRYNDGRVDHPTAERSPSPLQRTIATQSLNNNLSDDVGEGQRSAIETLYDSTAAEISSGTPQLLVQASLEEELSWSKHLPSSLDITSSQDHVHQSNAGQLPSSIAIHGPAEHPSLLTTPSKCNGHPPSLDRRDPVPPARWGLSRDVSPGAYSATSHRSSRTRQLRNEQASQIEESRGYEIMVRGQRQIQKSGSASVGASSSRAQEAHLEDPLSHEPVVRHSTPVGASSSRAPTAQWVQNRPSHLVGDPQGYDNPNRYSVYPAVFTQIFYDPVTWGSPHFGPFMPTRRTDPRPHTLSLTDEGTDEGAMVTRQQIFHRNLEVVGERSLDSPSPQPRRRSPENINPTVIHWMQGLNASGSQGLATDTPHNVDHASVGISSPDLTRPSAADPSQCSSSTTNALPRRNQAALRLEYKQDLLDTTRAWPEPPSEDFIRSLIKLDDNYDNHHQFAITDQNIHVVHRDWRNYEFYARKRRPRDSSLSFPVYGDPLFRDLDILKLWVNSNEHLGQTWPPGYIPQYPDANERDIGDEISSIGTEDQVSIVTE